MATFASVNDASFNDVNDTLIYLPVHKGALMTLSCTDAATQVIRLQTEQGAPFSDVWLTLHTWNKGVAAPTFTYTNKDNARVRAYLHVDDGGSNSMTIAEEEHQVYREQSSDGDELWEKTSNTQNWSGSVVGGITGDVTGNVTGDVTGDLTGTATGPYVGTAGQITYAGTVVTATGAELNILDTVTATAAEINKLAGTAAGLTAAELSILDGVTSTAAELNILDTVTADALELNKLDQSIYTYIYDDFLTATYDVALWSDGEGSDGGAAGPAIAANGLDGNITCVTAAVGNSSGAVDGSGFSHQETHWISAKRCVMEARVKINTVANSAIFVGFTDLALQDGAMEMPIQASGTNEVIIADADNAVGMLYDTEFDSFSATANAVGVNATNVETAIQGGVSLVDDTYITVRVDLLADLSVIVSVNGTALTTITTAIATGIALTPCVVFLPNTTAARTGTVDYIMAVAERS